jgi:hypothetical protein
MSPWKTPSRPAGNQSECKCVWHRQPWPPFDTSHLRLPDPIRLTCGLIRSVRPPDSFVDSPDLFICPADRPCHMLEESARKWECSDLGSHKEEFC